MTYRRRWLRNPFNAVTGNGNCNLALDIEAKKELLRLEIRKRRTEMLSDLCWWWAGS